MVDNTAISSPTGLHFKIFRSINNYIDYRPRDYMGKYLKTPTNE